MRAPPSAALLLAACATGRIHPDDVAARFEAEHAVLELRLPSREDLKPGRARDTGGAMRATTLLAREYLAARGERGHYVRALLACSYLMQGRTEAAREILRGIESPPVDRKLLSRESFVIAGARRALSACRAVEAKMALEETFRRERTVADFVLEYGSHVGVDLPAPDAELYATALRREIETLRESCFSRLDGDPRGLERVARSRAELRRMVGEQIYNDAVELLDLLPPAGPGPSPAPEEWFASLAASLMIVYARVMPDLLPYDLSEAQKEWQREQAYSVFARARDAAAHFGKRDPLYAGLVAAEEAVIGWISVR